MATTNILKTHLLQRIDTLENWQNSNPKLLRGELAVVILGEQSTTHKGLGGDTTKTPIVATKYGDGVNNFNDLAWSQSCAADVSSFIKGITNEEGFNTLVDARITNADLASNDSLEAAITRITTVEGNITDLQAVCVTGTDSNENLRKAINSVSSSLTTKIEDAEKNAKAYADTQAAAAQTAAEATAAADATAKVNALKNGEVKSNTDAISGINSKIGETDIGAGETLTSAIKALQDSVGTSGENSLGSRVDTLEGEMDTAQDNITDLQGRMTTAEGEIDTLQSITAGYTGANAIQTAVAEAKKAGTDAADAVAAEKTRAEGVEAGLRTDVDKALAFLGTAVDTEDDAVIDTLKEIQDYIKSDESGASAMAANIQKNTDAIGVLNGTGAGSVDKKIADAIAGVNTNVSDQIAAVTNRVKAIEDAPYATTANVATAKAEAVSTVKGTSADASSAETVAGAKKYAEEKASAAQTAAATDATSKANKALTDAKAYTDTEIGKVNDTVSSVETIAKAELTSTGSGMVSEVAKNTETGAITVTKRKVKNADMDETDVFVFYCGNAEGYDASFTSVDI